MTQILTLIRRSGMAYSRTPSAPVLDAVDEEYIVVASESQLMTFVGMILDADKEKTPDQDQRWK